MRFHRRFLSIVVLAVALAACTPTPTYKGTDVTGIDWGGEVALQAHTGKRISTADFRDKVIVLFFGYSHCPDICGPTLAKLAGLRKALGPAGEQVQVFFVTVDPMQDTAEQLAGFVPKFDPTFIGLTGKPDEVAAVARDYKVAAVPSTVAGAASMQMAHTGTVFVKDGDGKMRLLWKNETSVADMEHDVRLLLR